MSVRSPVAAVPTLDELAVDPDRALTLPPDVLQAKWLQCLGALNALAPAIAGAVARPTTTHPAYGDRLLPIDEAAALIGVKPAWMARHHKQFPFTRKLSRKVIVFDQAGLRKWLAARRG
jgi:hypothetical protein